MSNPADKPRKRAFHFKNIRPKDPAIKAIGAWSFENRGFYASFRDWLKDSGYSRSALNLYSVAVRQTIGLLDKPYWQIDPESDLQKAEAYFMQRSLTEGTQSCYHKGLSKLGEYIRLRNHKPLRTPQVNWERYLEAIPAWLQEDVRGHIRTCSWNWKPEHQHRRTLERLSPLCRALRWIVAHFPIEAPADLTPQVWFAYLDARLTAGINSSTVNGDLFSLKSLVYYWQDQQRPVCERFLLLDPIKQEKYLPKDAPLEQLRELIQIIQAEAASTHVSQRRMGRMDLAWALLMLHAGLRTAEVCSLRLGDIDWERRRLRIEQAKGMKDRYVYLSQEAMEALHSYLELRGPADALPEQVFIFRHCPLTPSYCYMRLRTYGKRGKLHITPHQLRHSCATLLLNAGAPILSVQALLGHKWVDTTLGYARLYDGTVAADYYTAMHGVEQRLALPEDRLSQSTGLGHLLALVDALRQTSLSEAQLATLRLLRTELLTLGE